MILVTGGTGFLGKRLVRALASQGRRVRVLTRTAPPKGGLPSSTEVATGDLLDQRCLATALQDVHAVVHLAAARARTPQRMAENEWASVNVVGTENLAVAAKAADVQAFVFVSTASVYGGSGGRHRHTEMDRPNPSSTYATSKLESEEVLRAQLRESGVRWVILRPTHIFGVGSSTWEDLFESVWRRRLWIHVGPRTFIHPVYVNDVVRCILVALDDARVDGAVINLAGEGPVPYASVLGAMSEACGRHLVQIFIPAALTRLPARFVASVVRSSGRIPAYSLERLQWREDYRVIDSTLARDRLGFSPTPLRTAVREEAGIWLENRRDREHPKVAGSEE